MAEKNRNARGSRQSRDIDKSQSMTRRERREAEEIYRKFGRAAAALEDWKLYILSSHTEFERAFGKNAVKKRKLYNGMIKCDLFMYY